MSELPQELLFKIERAQTCEDIEGWLWKAGDLIAKTTYEVYHSGFEEIDSTVVSAEDAEKLKQALLNALKRSSEPRFVSQILDCLLMTHDPGLKPLYVAYLERYLRQLKDSNGVVYSCLNALNRLNEDVYEKHENGRSGQSLVDIDKNVRQANRYLSAQGINQGW